MNCANHPDRERQAFCQNCGKPLCRECARTVGQAVFCEPCLEARLAAANAATQPPAPGYPPAGPPAAGSAPFGSGPTSASATYQDLPKGGQSYQYVGAAEGIPYNVSGSRPPPGTPNPVVAGLLGFIPGVGAMYNGQYAKGIVHLVIFAILTSLADAYSIFGIFVAAWIFYQAIEAYHTANARRHGTPPPNPFGFNDIGERFGFGRAWPTSNPPTSPVGSSAFVPPWQGPPPTAAPAGAPPGTPDAESFRYPPTPVAPSSSPYTSPVSAAAPDASGASYASVSGATYASVPGAAYGSVSTPLPPTAAPSRVPIGAIVLIGLGILFLLGNTHWLGVLPIHLLLPILVIGVGVWIFVRRMLSFGSGLADDGTPAYQLRVLQALQGSVWVMLVGVLFLLDSLHILSWGRSWPLFLIVGGVLFFLQRTAAASLAQRMAIPTPPVHPAAPGFSSTPDSTRDVEQL